MAQQRDLQADHKQQIRFPLDLVIWLKDRAEENCRSFNGEVIARLKEARRREEQEAANAQTA